MDPLFVDRDQGDFTPAAQAIIEGKHGLSKPEVLKALWARYRDLVGGAPHTNND